MSVKTAIEQLGAVLTADAGLIAWASAHFDKTLSTLYGNKPIAVVDPATLPLIVLELGDGENESEVLGGDIANTAASIEIAFVWQEEDTAQAFTQRNELADLLPLAIMRKATLNGAAAAAELVRWSSDRGANHPNQLFRATVRVDLEARI